MELERLLKAINIADYEKGKKEEVLVEVQDLVLLKNEIQALRENLKFYKKS